MKVRVKAIDTSEWVLHGLSVKYLMNFLPIKHKETDSCYDCKAILYGERDVLLKDSIIIPSKGYAKIPLGFSLNLKMSKFEKWLIKWGLKKTILAAQLRSRSGLASRGIITVHGTIDNTWDNEMIATVYNFSPDPLQINFGDRICQLFFEKVLITDLQTEFVKNQDELNGNSRLGFGSSGMR